LLGGCAAAAAGCLSAASSLLLAAKAPGLADFAGVDEAPAPWRCATQAGGLGPLSDHRAVIVTISSLFQDLPPGEVGG